MIRLLRWSPLHNTCLQTTIKNRHETHETCSRVQDRRTFLGSKLERRRDIIHNSSICFKEIN